MDLAVHGRLEAVTGLQRVMDTIVASALTRGVALPGRHVITAGGAVYDCEQVVASVMSAREGLANNQGDTVILIACDVPIAMNVEIAIVRCAEERNDGQNGDLPPRPEWMLHDLTAASHDADLLLAVAQELDMHQVNIRFNGPNGGMISTVLSAEVSML